MVDKVSNQAEPIEGKVRLARLVLRFVVERTDVRRRATCVAADVPVADLITKIFEGALPASTTITAKEQLKVVVDWVGGDVEDGAGGADRRASFVTGVTDCM